MQANQNMYINYSSHSTPILQEKNRKKEKRNVYINISKIFSNLFFFTFTLLFNQAATSIVNRTSTVPGVFVKCTSTQRVERVCAPRTLTRATIFFVSQSA